MPRLLSLRVRCMHVCSCVYAYVAFVLGRLVPIGYACSALSHGANIRTGRKVTALQLISSDDSASVDSLLTAAPMITSTISHTEKSPPIWKVITEEYRDRSIGRSYNGEVLTKVASAMPRRASTAVTNHRESDEIDGNSNSSTIAAVEGINRVDSDGGIYHGRVVINCAGLFGDELEALRRRALSALSTPASSDSSCRTNHSTSSGSRDSSSNEERTWSIARGRGSFWCLNPYYHHHHHKHAQTRLADCVQMSHRYRTSASFPAQS